MLKGKTTILAKAHFYGTLLTINASVTLMTTFFQSPTKDLSNITAKNIAKFIFVTFVTMSKK